MATTRRKLLQTAGAAAASALLLPRAGTAGGQATSMLAPRSLSYCMLQTPSGLGLGVKQGDRILDVAKAGKLKRIRVPATTDDVIAGRNLDGLQKVFQSAASMKGVFLQEGEAHFGPCLTAPQKIIMLGFNYRRHAKETGTPLPTAPVLFNKYNNALSGHGGTIKLRPRSRRNSTTKSSSKSSSARWRTR